MDLIIGYALALLIREQKELSYKIYTADVLRASIPWKDGQAPKRWYEVINPPKEIDAEKEIDDIINKMGLTRL